VIRLLRRLFGRRDAFGYTATDRDIFPYHDGTRSRRGDPLAIQHALNSTPGFDVSIHPGAAAAPSKNGLAAAKITADAVRAAFGVPAFDAGGLTDGQCLLLFIQFGEWLGKLREETRPLPSGPAPTGAGRPEVAGSRTEPLPASTSTRTELPTPACDR
jgi:hypothetical protein